MILTSIPITSVMVAQTTSSKSPIIITAYEEIGQAKVTNCYSLEVHVSGKIVMMYLYLFNSK